LPAAVAKDLLLAIQQLICCGRCWQALQHYPDREALTQRLRLRRRASICCAPHLLVLWLLLLVRCCRRGLPLQLRLHMRVLRMGERLLLPQFLENVLHLQ
jgi:hypothetical protein